MESEDKIERWIDQALRQHGNADPGPGFEPHLLARVREREGAFRARQRLWWAFSFTAVLTSVALASLWLSYGPHVPRPTFAHHQTEDGTTKNVPAFSPLPGRPATETNRAASTKRSPRATPLQQASGATSGDDPPKLDQFPSPAPLSEQEQIMMRYVSEHRQHAVMLARAETDLLDRERRQYQSPNFSGSEQNVSDNEK